MLNYWKLFLLLASTSLILGGLTEASNPSDYEYQVALLPMPPTIYAQAPSGVQVTVVRAQRIDSGTHSGELISTTQQPYQNAVEHGAKESYEIAAPCFPQYYLSRNQSIDYDRFSVHTCSGKIITARYVEKSVGDFYRIVVLVISNNNATLARRELEIKVTPYNSKQPTFTREHYTHEILDASDINTLALTVSATDSDIQAPNQEVYYTLQTLHDFLGLRKNPWLYPVTTPFAINPTSGEIYVSGSLSDDVPSPLRYRVLVADGGSPQRTGSAKLTLYIRNMSAPRNVRVQNITENSMEVCWSTPLHGNPDGYLVLYSSRGPVQSGNQLHKGRLNFTIDELEMKIDDEPIPLQFSTQQRADATPLQVSMEVQREMHDFFNSYFCTLISDLHPLTSYTISVRAWASHGRISMARIPLTVVTKRRTCNNSVCLHGICQERDAPPGFRCHCSPGYYGERCQLVENCIVNGTLACLNGGTCLRAQEQGTHECVCSPGYSGARCEVVNSCVAPGNVCLNGGTCLSGYGDTYSCLCLANFTGPACEIAATSTPTSSMCEADQTNTPEGILDWPPTSLGSTAYFPCPFGLFSHSEEDTVVQVQLSPSNETETSNNYDYVPLNTSDSRGSRSERSPSVAEDEVDTLEIFRRITRSLNSLYGASRTCVMGQRGGFSVYWLPPNLSSCRTDEEEADEIVNVTASSRKTNATVIASSVRKIAHLVNRAVADSRIAEKMVAAISHILDANTSLIDQTNEESPNATDTILAAIHEYTAKVSLQPGEKVVHRAENLIVEAQLLVKEFLPDEITFNPLASEENSSGRTRGNPYKKHTVDTKKVWIKVPKSALENASQENIRFQFISFKNDHIFRGRNHTRTLNHRVLSASINGVRTYKLPAPISYMIPIQKIDPMLVLPKCVFWNISEHDWSTEGVHTRQTKKGEVFCEADHLTSFSILLDPIGSPIAAELKPALSTITYIGIALSTVALIATIVTFALFRSMNRDRSGLIVMNLSVALLLLNLGFLGSLFITSEYEWCVVFGGLLHYAVAASFSWMLIEAVNMYQLLVTVFPSSETHFMRKRVILGWGIPLIFVAAALIWDGHVYFTEYQSACVISSTVAPVVYYTTYLAPVCVVLFINFVVFLRVLRVLCQGRPSYKRSVSVTIAQIRGAVAIVTLLGITWLLGVFAVGQFRMVSQFLFCLTTPFQGLIIFWVRVMQSAEARMAWKSFLTTGSTRLRPRPLSSVRTNSSLHHSSSLHTHSTDLTSSSSQKSSAFVSALKAAGRGFMGSSKMRYERNNSNKNSSKKLKKSLSRESEKQPTSVSCKTPTKSEPVIDSQYRRLSNRASQDSSAGSGLSNGKATALSPVIREDLCKQEPLYHETNTQNEIEQAPLKDLHYILDGHPFFHNRSSEGINRTMVNSKHVNEYEESILTNSCQRSLSKQQSYWKKDLENERNSVSTSNLNHPHNIQTILPGEGKRSLESLRRVVVFDPKVRQNRLSSLPHQDTGDVERGISPRKPKSQKQQTPSCQNQVVDHTVNGNYNDNHTTKSLSDTLINGPTPDNFSKLERQKYLNQQPEDDNEETLETQPLTDVVPLDNFKRMSLAQRATSEQNIGPNLKDMESPFRRSVSNAELDCSDHSENPQENLLPR